MVRTIVPYGLHGHFFSEKEIMAQRPVVLTRSVPVPSSKQANNSLPMRFWMGIRERIECVLG